MTTPTRFSVPPDLPFASLQLRRAADGTIEFDAQALGRLLAHNGIAPTALPDEDAVSELLTAWYLAHRAGGGDPDPTMQDLLAEMRAEDDLGDGLSHPPGRA